MFQAANITDNHKEITVEYLTKFVRARVKDVTGQGFALWRKALNQYGQQRFHQGYQKGLAEAAKKAVEK